MRLSIRELHECVTSHAVASPIVSAFTIRRADSWEGNTWGFRMTSGGRSMNNKVWIGIAIGAGIGIAFAVSSRSSRRSRWDRWDTREMTKRLVDSREDLLDKGKEMMERLRVIYEEGRKV